MKKILIVNANYYSSISLNLIAKCKEKLKSYNFKISIVHAPGCFEIPILISKNIKKFDGFVALGCLIKGETPHFDLISKATFEALIQISVIHKKPIGNGIITALNKRQAINRSSLKKRFFKPNKGIEAANAVISVLINEPKIT